MNDAMKKVLLVLLIDDVYDLQASDLKSSRIVCPSMLSSSIDHSCDTPQPPTDLAGLDDVPQGEQ
jgi:hypothetical protein